MVTSGARPNTNQTRPMSLHRPINQKSAQSDFNYGIFLLNHKLRHSGTYQPAVRTRRCNPLSSARITPLASRMRAIVQDAYS
ncbi:hypothetical protein V6Z94_002754 [Aspergillus fumigatus]